MALDISSHYKLDENQGSTVLVDNTGTYNGTIVNDPTLQQPPIETQGFGTSMLYGYEEYQYLEIPNRDSIQGISINYRPYEYVDATNNSELFSQYITDGDRFLFRIHSLGHVEVYLNNVTVISTDAIVRNRFIDYHFVVQYNSVDATTYIWINGVKQAQSYAGNVFKNSAVKTRAGVWQSVSGTFYGKPRYYIDNLYLLNTCLDQDVATLYTLHTPRNITYLPEGQPYSDNIQGFPVYTVPEDPIIQIVNNPEGGVFDTAEMSLLFQPIQKPSITKMIPKQILTHPVKPNLFAPLREPTDPPYVIFGGSTVADLTRYVSGITKVNGVGTKCKIFLFDKDMNVMDSFFSNEDGTFKLYNLYNEKSEKQYHVVVQSLTGECPEISGLLSPTQQI